MKNIMKKILVGIIVTAYGCIRESHYDFGTIYKKEILAPRTEVFYGNINSGNQYSTNPTYYNVNYSTYYTYIKYNNNIKRFNGYLIYKKYEIGDYYPIKIITIIKINDEGIPVTSNSSKW